MSVAIELGEWRPIRLLAAKRNQTCYTPLGFFITVKGFLIFIPFII
jgi:hypothetical protein